MSYVIATSRSWNTDLVEKLREKTQEEIILITRKEDLTVEYLQSITPRYLFFPHWSYIIPEEIYTQFECVIFHMTDLPFGRGGSPLQNLISRGIYQTRLSALRCVRELDAGDIYLKKELSLHGNAEEIFLRASSLVEEMILEILEKGIQPKPQEGKAIVFQRRKPEDGDISGLMDLNQVYDFIRMLDADGYPPAFLEVGNFRFEFSRSALKHGKVIADVKISEITK